MTKPREVKFKSMGDCRNWATQMLTDKSREFETALHTQAAIDAGGELDVDDIEACVDEERRLIPERVDQMATELRVMMQKASW